MTSEIDNIREGINEQLLRAQRAATIAAELQEDMAQIIGRGQSADEHVRAQVDSQGFLRDIQLNEKAMLEGPEHLRESVLESLTDAARDVQAQARPFQEAIMKELQPDTFDQNLSAKLLDAVAQPSGDIS